jgi:hypothetical protein
LLAKLQERRGGNQQVQLISVEPRREDPRVNVIMRGGAVIGEDRVTLENTVEGSGIRRATDKTHLFDPGKERQTRREFGGEQASSSKAEPEVRECRMHLAFVQCASHGEGKKVRNLVSFLYTFIDLNKDERVVQELQNLIRQYEIAR